MVVIPASVEELIIVQPASVPLSAVAKLIRQMEHFLMYLDL